MPATTATPRQPLTADDRATLSRRLSAIAQAMAQASAYASDAAQEALRQPVGPSAEPLAHQSAAYGLATAAGALSDLLGLEPILAAQLGRFTESRPAPWGLADLSVPSYATVQAVKAERAALGTVSHSDAAGELAVLAAWARLTGA